MKNFIKKIGFGWVIMATIPWWTLISVIGKLMHIPIDTRLTLQIIGLIVQVSSLVIMIKYNKEIWKI